MIVTKKTCITTSFYLAYLTFLTFSMFGHIPTVGGYLKELTNVGLAIFVIIVCLRLRDYSAQEGVVFAILLSYSLFVAFRTGDYGVLKLGVMGFACKGLDFKRIVKRDLYTRILFIFIMLYLWLSGAAPDVTSVYNGTVRHSMGFQNPNHVGLFAVIMIMEILYLSEMHLSIVRYVAVFAILMAEDYIAGSRTAEFIALIAIGLAMVYSFYPRFYEKKIVRSIMCWGGMICATITATAFFLFKSASGVAIIMDKIFSGRITNIVFYYSRLWVSILGKNPLSVSRTIDSLYGYSFIVLGIFAFLIIMMTYYKIEQILCQSNMPLAIIMFCLFVYGLSERLWMYIDYNILMLAFAELIYSGFTTNGNNIYLSCEGESNRQNVKNGLS